MRVINSLEISDEAEVGAARRAIRRYASPLGFNDTELAELDIVVQEIGTNAARYATGGGWLHYTAPLGTVPGIELFYCDKGPGIYDLDRAVRDGASSSGSLGGGMGAIRRLMHEFDVYSTVRTTPQTLSARRRTTHGTALLGRKWAAPPTPRRGHLLPPEESIVPTDETAQRFGVWSRPLRSEEVNGDACLMRRRAGVWLLAVVDGLGHGRGAHTAAAAALETLEQWTGEPLDEVFGAVHEALRATRGAVMGAALIDEARETFHYAGVGNIDVRVFNAPERIRPIPINGTLGTRLPKIRVWAHQGAEGATLVMTSDGLSSAWDIDS